jgi:hypothetical protein
MAERSSVGRVWDVSSAKVLVEACRWGQSLAQGIRARGKFREDSLVNPNLQ